MSGNDDLLRSHLRAIFILSSFRPVFSCYLGESGFKSSASMFISDTGMRGDFLKEKAEDSKQVHY